MRLPAFVRRLTDPLAGRVPVPILGGVNRGRWWCLASAGSGYATGRRAASQMAVLEIVIQPGDVVWDVGAHHGYVSLWASKLATRSGSVHAFEPEERNRRILRRHLEWNGAERVRVHGCALSSYDGRASFGGGSTSKTQSLGSRSPEDGEEGVPVRTGASLVASGDASRPTFVKIDVEGGESGVLEGLGDALPADAAMVIAVHSAEEDRRCSTLLEERGFRLLPSARLRGMRGGEWTSDPDLLCLGPERPGLNETLDRLESARF